MFHALITVGSAILTAIYLLTGDMTWAAIQGAITSVLAWQLTW